jgi:Flp pilus assembly protein TadG
MRKRSSQDGAVLVEMAVMLPLLVFLVVGTVDYGLILREFELLQNGAREAARFSVLPQYQIATGVTPAARTARLNAIKQSVVDYLANENITINASNVTVDQTASIDMGGIRASASEITVSYTRSILIGGGWNGLGSVPLKGHVIWRNLY